MTLSDFLLHMKITVKLKMLQTLNLQKRAIRAKLAKMDIR